MGWRPPHRGWGKRLEIMMPTKLTAFAVVGALAFVGGLGYVTGAGSGSAAARSPVAKSGSDPMMSGGGSMMAMMDAEHAKMMRDPAMRQMHRTMVREHAKTMRDGQMRRQHQRAMRDFPNMARMMREHMED